MTKKRLLIVASILLTFLLAATAVLILTKRINSNQYLVGADAIRGIDVSHYQGEINWEEIQKQNVKFAFVKATEGSSYVDETFSYNWENATQSGILTGAYHFFSFDSTAESQAEIYIETVGDLSGHLIPAIDVEYYGDKEANPPAVEEVIPQLQQLLTLLEQKYQKKPIIYSTYKAYHRYLKDNFSEYPLWIRNVYYLPVDIGRQWTFWQYSDSARLSGMMGQEECVDLNVFCGNEEELNEYVMK